VKSYLVADLKNLPVPWDDLIAVASIRTAEVLTFHLGSPRVSALEKSYGVSLAALKAVPNPRLPVPGPGARQPREKGIKPVSTADLWRELHGRPLVLAGADDEAKWLAEFYRRLPCGPCRAMWRADLLADPPDFSSAAAYARWTWRRHDAVSARLGKPRMSYEDADGVYGWTLE
jgi:Erv1 / Alr family